MTNLNKLTMTLVLLIMAATGAWAKPAYTTFEVGKVIKLGETISPAENLSFNGETFILDGDYSYTLVRVNRNGADATEADDGAYYAFRQVVSNNIYGQQCAFTVTGTTDGLVVTAVNDNSITLAVHHIYDPVLQADGTWQFTMPAYNMLLEAEMKDESQTTVTYDGVTPSADTKVKAYMGFEEYFASKLAATVMNLTQDEPVQSPTFTYKTSNPAVIAFDNGTDYPQGAGTLAQMRFYGTGDAELTVQYTGTGDISKSEAALHVTVAQPATLTLVADPTTGGTVEAVIPETGLKVAKITGDMVAGWNTGDYAGELLEAADLEGFQPVSLDVVKQWVGPKTDFAYLYYAFEGTSSEDIYAKYAQYAIGTGEYENNSSQQVTKSQAYDWALNTQCNYTSYYTLGYTQSNITKNSDGTYSVIPGTSVSLKATPAEGYYLDYWSTNATADEEDKTVATLAVGENATTVTATACFDLIKYDVDLTVNGDDDQGTEKALWTGKAGEQGTADNFPITAKTGQMVIANYDGNRKVKRVRAVLVPTYLKWDATKKEWVEADSPANATKVENADGNVTWAAGTYLVDGNVTINGKVTLAGDVELIIKDGAKLTANSIYGDGKYSLNIYGQANKSGELNVACSNSDAAISYLTVLNIHSCKVNASGSYYNCGGFYGIDELNVYGGSVDAKYTGGESGYGLCDISSLNIWDGEMKAEGKGTGNYGYGITYRSGVRNVTVYGGKLWVKNADNKALDPSANVTFTKADSYTKGKIETSADGETWTVYNGSDKPDTKYVRVGY